MAILVVGGLAACVAEPRYGPPPSTPMPVIATTVDIPLFEDVEPGVLVSRTRAGPAEGVTLLGVAWWREAWWLGLTWPQRPGAERADAVGLRSVDLQTAGHRWPAVEEGSALHVVGLPDGPPILAYRDGRSVLAWAADKAAPTLLYPPAWDAWSARPVAWAPSSLALGWGSIWEEDVPHRGRRDPRGPWSVGRELDDPDVLPYTLTADAQGGLRIRRGPGGRLAVMWAGPSGNARVWRAETQAVEDVGGRPFAHFFLQDGQLVVATDGGDSTLELSTEMTTWRLPVGPVGSEAVDLHCGERDLFVFAGLWERRPHLFVLSAPGWQVFAAEPLSEARMSGLTAACGPAGVAVSWQAYPRPAGANVIHSYLWAWK